MHPCLCSILFFTVAVSGEGVWGAGWKEVTGLKNVHISHTDTQQHGDDQREREVEGGGKEGIHGDGKRLCWVMGTWHSVQMLKRTQYTNYRVGKKKHYSCEYANTEFILYYYLLIIVLFSMWTTLMLLLPFPTPMVYKILQQKEGKSQKKMVNEEHWEKIVTTR